MIWFWKSGDGVVVNWFFRGFGQTLLSNREWLCSSQPVVVSSDTASHCCIRLAEEVHSTSWNDAICKLKPCSHRTPAVERRLKESLPHLSRFSNVVVSWPQLVHIGCVCLPVLRNHVDQTRTTTNRLVDVREVPCLPSNFRQYLCDCIF